MAQPTYTLQVVNAVVAPAKGGGGKSWDGTNAIPPDVMNEVILAASKIDGCTAVGLAFAKLGNSVYDPPDVAADVALQFSGAPVQTQQLAAIQDSYMPSWASPATFNRVPLDDRLSIAVRLIDRDVAFDDEIGTVTIPMGEIRMAVSKGGAIHQVRVRNQNQQILLVGVAAHRE